MKRILTIITATMLSVGAWAASDLTLNVAQTVAFGDWGFSNEAAPTITLGNWASGGGWQFDSALSQNDYCGVDFTFEATTETHVTFMICYEGGAEQSIDVPTGSTSIKADFAYTGSITKIGFKYGDWEATANADGASITITKALVKANSTGEVVELAFADLSDSATDSETGAVVYTKDADNQTITLNNYTWASYWSFDPAILSDDYEKIVITFAEAVPVSGLTINAEVEGDESWCGTTLGSIAQGATKATAYFSELPSASITKIGFFLDWQAASATVKIAKVELVKSTELVRLVGIDDNDDVYTKVYTVGPNRLSISVEKTQNDGELSKTAHGIVTATGEVTDEGTVIKLTPTPDSGYELDKLVVEKVASAGKADARLRRAPEIPVVLDPVPTTVEIDNATRTFTMDCTMLVTATFVKISATAINPAEWSKADGQSDSQWYDLQGRRVMQPQKGIYIKDGKKVVVK